MWEAGAINKGREKNFAGGSNSTEIQVCSCTAPDSPGNHSLGSANHRGSCGAASCASAGNTGNSCQETPIPCCPCRAQPREPGHPSPAPPPGAPSQLQPQQFAQCSGNESSDGAGGKEPMEHLSFPCALKSGTEKSPSSKWIPRAWWCTEVLIKQDKELQYLLCCNKQLK